MFCDCLHFNKDISSWDLENAQSKINMFGGVLYSTNLMGILENIDPYHLPKNTF